MKKRCRIPINVKDPAFKKQIKEFAVKEGFGNITVLTKRLWKLALDGKIRV
jgi:hypothetical protein